MQRAVIAGHICLDVIPGIDHAFEPEPGRLFEVGPALMSTGGAVANTGLALHLLGMPVTLMGKIGADAFGNAIRTILQRTGTGLDAGLIETADAATSYSIVINIPGRDRTFLHCPGANHSFGDADVTDAGLAGAGLFHLGYPPLMDGLYREAGRALEAIYRRVRSAGLTTSMDMTVPDPDGPSGRADWTTIFARTLPLLDVFLPSADELLYIYDRPRFGAGDLLGPAELSALTGRLLEAGVAVAGIKLGRRGLYIRTAGRDRLAAAGVAAPRDTAAWAERELWFPVFDVPVAGTTGAGDITIAGFLAALLRGATLVDAGRSACAAGACCVQAPAALGGLESWAAVRQLVDANRPIVPLAPNAPGWRIDPVTGVGHGPADQPPAA